jgi:hypothetical protein
LYFVLDKLPSAGILSPRLYSFLLNPPPILN